MGCDVGHRHGLDLALLWLWCRLASVAPTGPLAWEPPYVMGAALKSKKKKKNKETKKPQEVWIFVMQKLAGVLNGCIVPREDFETITLQLAATSRYGFESSWCCP